jgi:hypothetical protein
MSEPEVAAGVTPIIEDWDDAPAPRPVWFVVLVGALVTIGAAAAALAVTTALTDDDPQAQSSGPTRTADDYNPTGYDGDEAEVALDRVSVDSGGNTVVLLFDGPRSSASRAIVGEVAETGSCEPLDRPSGVGSYLNLELDGPVDLTGLRELNRDTGVIVTGRRPVGAVRSLTVTCHGPDQTVLAVGLTDEHLYSVDDPPGSDRIVIQLSA